MAQSQQGNYIIPCKEAAEIEMEVYEFQNTLWGYLHRHSGGESLCCHSTTNIFDRARLGLVTIEPKVLEHTRHSRDDVSTLRTTPGRDQNHDTDSGVSSTTSAVLQFGETSDVLQDIVPVSSSNIAQRHEGITISCEEATEIEKKVLAFGTKLCSHLHRYAHGESGCCHSTTNIFERARLGLRMIERKVLEHTGLSRDEARALRANPGRDHSRDTDTTDSRVISATSAVFHREEVLPCVEEMQPVSPEQEDLGESERPHSFQQVPCLCRCIQSLNIAAEAHGEKAFCEVGPQYDGCSRSTSYTGEISATAFRRPSTGSTQNKRISTNPNILD